MERGTIAVALGAIRPLEPSFAGVRRRVRWDRLGVLVAVLVGAVLLVVVRRPAPEPAASPIASRPAPALRRPPTSGLGKGAAQPHRAPRRRSDPPRRPRRHPPRRPAPRPAAVLRRRPAPSP